jgi:hypothetical protein
MMICVGWEFSDVLGSENKKPARHAHISHEPVTPFMNDQKQTSIDVVPCHAEIDSKK